MIKESITTGKRNGYKYREYINYEHLNKVIHLRSLFKLKNKTKIALINILKNEN